MCMCACDRVRMRRNRPNDRLVHKYGEHDHLPLPQIFWNTIQKEANNTRLDMGSSTTATPALDSVVTAEFLGKCLQAPIVSYTVNAGSSAGDNFTSVVHAIKVTYKGKGKDNACTTTTTVDLMLKSYPSHPARRSFLDDTLMFQKELLVYKTLLPELIRFGKAQVPDFDTQFKLAVVPFVDGRSTPTSTATTAAGDALDLDLTQNFILMVDMRSLGFKMADKAMGLDYAHCRLVFTELAKLHALNWAYTCKAGLSSLRHKFPFLKDGVFCVEQTPVLTGILGQNFELLKGLLTAELGEKSDVLKGFLRFETNPFEKIMFFLNDDEGEGDGGGGDGHAGWDEEKMGSFFRVTPETRKGARDWKCGSHGDMWVNNILFRYAEGSSTPLETVFVDLQLYRDASPLVDLAYFIYSSTNTALRRQHLNDLLRLYSDVFLEKCGILGVDPFPGFAFAELQRRFHLAKLFGFITAVMLLPIILIKPEEATDMDTVSSETTKFDDMFKEMGLANSGLLKERMAELVRELYEDGLL